MVGFDSDNADVIVIGGGTAGCVAATAAARAGVRVLLMESRAIDDVGRKACGGALSSDAVRAVSEIVGPLTGAEVAGTVTSGLLGLPGSSPAAELDEPGVVLNRPVLGQRLLIDCLESGVTLLSGHTCIGWSDRSKRTVGVRCPDGTETSITGLVVVDATGFRSILTKTGGPTHPDHLRRSETGIGYYEILPLAKDLDRPNRAIVQIAPEGARDGYAWIFPMGSRLVNAGIGASLATADRSLRRRLHSYLDSSDLVDINTPKVGSPRSGSDTGGSDVARAGFLRSGSGMIPLRRPLASLVGDGFLSVGDAACQTNPLHGGGIAPSIIAGSVAGRVAGAAVRAGDCSAAGLWEYGVETMHTLGAPHAAQDLIRRLIGHLRPDEVAFVAGEMAAAGRAFRSLYSQSPGFRVREILGTVGRAARRPALLKLLIESAHCVSAIHRLYRNYPESPDRLGTWIGSVEIAVRSFDRLVRKGRE